MCGRISTTINAGAFRPTPAVVATPKNGTGDPTTSKVPYPGCQCRGKGCGLPKSVTRSHIPTSIRFSRGTSWHPASLFIGCVSTQTRHTHRRRHSVHSTAIIAAPNAILETLVHLSDASHVVACNCNIMLPSVTTALVWTPYPLPPGNNVRRTKANCKRTSKGATPTSLQRNAQTVRSLYQTASCVK